MLFLNGYYHCDSTYADYQRPKCFKIHASFLHPNYFYFNPPLNQGSALQKNNISNLKIATSSI